VGWEHLVIRPDTKLTPADKKRVEKAVRRAKKEGKIALTAQQTIPYEEMYQDGICRITNRLYSKSVLCEDINYSEASDDEKAVLFELYCKLVNYFGPAVGFELSVICYPADLSEYQKMLAINPKGDQFDAIRKEYSDMLVRQVSKSRYERRICLTYTIEADNVKQARSRLGQIDNDVVGHFRSLNVAARSMSGYERLATLHKCLNLEETRKFRFNWDSLNHTGLSSKDYIAPSSFFFYDYTFYNADFAELDGGQLDDPKLSMAQAIYELLSDEGWQDANLEALDYEFLMEKADTAEKERLAALAALKTQEAPLLRVVPVGRFERYIEPSEITQDQYIVKGGILLSPCASNPDYYESSNRALDSRYIDPHIYEVAQRSKSGNPTAFRVVEDAPVENPFEPVGKEIGIAQAGQITCGLVFKHQMEGFKLTDQTVLLQKERDAHGNYYGGISLDGMMLKTPKMYAAVKDEHGQITAFRRMREKDFTVVTKPSEFQKELVAELGERAEDVRNRLVEPREDNMLKITSDGRKLALDQRLAFPELPDDPESKVNACVGNVLQVWRDTEPQKGAQLVFSDLSTPHGDGSFNVYDDIKQKLMAQGIPPEQIAFIHDAKTETQKAELFSKVRKGQVRVLLGSTSKMGAGTNVQTRLAALHHLDCPWRPADIEQREGRILRQGNMFESVKIFKYVTEGTFDAYNWGLIENKQKFIGQLMSGKNPSRSCEDVDEAALSYAEVKALASGDPRIMEKTELDGQVTKLKLLKANHENQRYSLEDKLIKFFPQAIKREQELIAALEADIKHLEAHTPPDKEHFSMTVMGKTYTERKEAGQAIINAFDSLKDLSDKVELGEYRGFPMTLWVSDTGFSQKLQITLKNELSHSVEPGSDPSGNITRLDNALEAMKDNLEKYKASLENLIQQTEEAKIEVKRPFPQEAELAEKSARLNALNVALNIGGKDKPKDRERQARDGKTSIKRLLRRMGVESAASAAAPKKDKELEVAI